MNALICVAASVMAVALPAAATAPRPAASPAPAAAIEARRTPFTYLGASATLPLPGEGASAHVDFGSRSDELVTRAVFHFRYACSPALSPAISHIRVALNDEVIGTLPVGPDVCGRTLPHDLEADPRLIVGFNRVVMSLVAAKGAAAEDPARPGLWAEVSGASELELAVQPLAVADDLAMLPEPFFDRHDQRRVVVPFAFAGQPSAATLRAAAVVASWLGQHASWRGARFPVQLDAAAPGHAVAFAANGERPAFLAGLPPAAGPELRLMTNPADRRSKLLVVAGRDGEEVKLAADALALGPGALSGASVQVKRVEDKGPREPYDAPRFVRTDRAVKLAELIDWPQQLESSGRPAQLEPIRVDLRVPPDLATWRSPGIPLVLKLQYTPPPCTADANLDIAVNDELLQVLPLKTAQQSVTEAKETFIPGFRLRSRVRLQFGYRFTLREEPACRDARTAVVKVAVSPESTLDFSGFPHYVRMPNLEHFVGVGFPFTRIADLSETVVVLPAKPAAPDIEVMLGLMGRMGDATGLPATRVRVALAADEAALAGADLLVIGAAPQQALLARWAGALPAKAPASSAGSGPLAAIYGFESPLTSGRSVVAVTAVGPDQMVRVLDALDDNNARRAVEGSAAFVMPYNKVESVLAEPTYSVGFFPPWTGAGAWIGEHPVATGFIVLVAALVLRYGLRSARFAAYAWRTRSSM